MTASLPFDRQNATDSAGKPKTCHPSAAMTRSAQRQRAVSAFSCARRPLHCLVISDHWDNQGFYGHLAEPRPAVFDRRSTAGRSRQLPSPRRFTFADHPLYLGGRWPQRVRMIALHGGKSAPVACRNMHFDKGATIHGATIHWIKLTTGGLWSWRRHLPHR